MLFPDEYDWHGCAAVEFDHLKLSGRATVGATRLDADSVFRNYLDGMTLEEFVEEFNADPQLIQQIIDFGLAHGYADLEVVEVLFTDEYEWHGCTAVQFDSLKLGGRATVGSTRLDADSVFRNYLGGMTVTEFIDEFNADPVLIEQIIQFGLAHGYEKAA